MIYKYTTKENEHTKSLALSSLRHNSKRRGHNQESKRAAIKKRDRQKTQKTNNENNIKCNFKISRRKWQNSNSKRRNNLDIQSRYQQETEKETRKECYCLKEIIVKFDSKAYQEYLKLKKKVELKEKSNNPSYEQLLRSINNTLKILKLNIHFGDLIPRKYLNKKLIQRYGTDKILRIELVGYWRLLYTIIGEETKIIAFILEYIDHKTYNKRFRYKKS